MPYLHFEDYSKFEEMSLILKEVFKRRKSKKDLDRKNLGPHNERALNELLRNAPLHLRPALEHDFLSALSVENLNKSPRGTRRALPEPVFRGKKMSRDEKLIQSYLSDANPRRTLDQYYFPAGNTSERDKDQVVTRFCKEQEIGEPKLFMVDQLWLWILGNGSFPYRLRNSEVLLNRPRPSDYKLPSTMGPNYRG